jgi:hypothetical protein
MRDEEEMTDQQALDRWQRAPKVRRLNRNTQVWEEMTVVHEDTAVKTTDMMALTDEIMRDAPSPSSSPFSCEAAEAFSDVGGLSLPPTISSALQQLGVLMKSLPRRRIVRVQTCEMGLVNIVDRFSPLSSFISGLSYFFLLSYFSVRVSSL